MNIALSTPEGVLTGMSSSAQCYPDYHTPGFEVRINVQLPEGMRETFRQAIERTDGNIIRPIDVHLRSGLAQAGLEAGHPSCTQVKMQGNAACITTMITDVNDLRRHPVLKMVRSMAQERHVQMMELLYLPDEAKTGEEMLPLLSGGSYKIRWQDIPSKKLRAALQGKSLRKTIKKHREFVRDPKVIGPDDFYLGQVFNPSSNGDLVVLSREIFDAQGASLPWSQLSAVRWQPKRSCHKPREVEVKPHKGSEPMPPERGYFKIERFTTYEHLYEEFAKWK